MKTYFLVLLIATGLVGGTGLLIAHLNSTNALSLPPSTTVTTTTSTPIASKTTETNGGSSSASHPILQPAPVVLPKTTPTPSVAPAALTTPTPTPICTPSANASCPVFYVDPSTSPKGSTVKIVLYNNCPEQIGLPNTAPWHIEDKNGATVYSGIAAQVYGFLPVGQTKTWDYAKVNTKGEPLPVGTYVAVLDASTHPRAPFEVTQP